MNEFCDIQKKKYLKFNLFFILKLVFLIYFIEINFTLTFIIDNHRILNYKNKFFHDRGFTSLLKQNKTNKIKYQHNIKIKSFFQLRYNDFYSQKGFFSVDGSVAPCNAKIATLHLAIRLDIGHITSLTHIRFISMRYENNSFLHALITTTKFFQNSHMYWNLWVKIF